MRRVRTPAPVLAALLAACSAAPAPEAWHWRLLPDTGSRASLRGLSALSAEVCWVAGAQGTVLRTRDGGRTWQRVGPPGCEALDFRSVRAFDADTAWIANAGAPARILRTEDGGVHWTLAHEDARPAAFFDSLAAWDRRCGLVLGDPIERRFTLLQTRDGGRTWQADTIGALPEAASGEAAFAASNSCIAVHGAEAAWLVTGGTRARVLFSTDAGAHWQQAPLPLAQGNASAGAFGVAFRDAAHGVVVGGDYAREREPAGTAAWTADGGRTWLPAQPGPDGYRSDVAWLSGTGTSCIAVGPSGTSLSGDGGKTWQQVSAEGFHAVEVAADGAVWACGGGGRVAVRK